ncbi:unnamed protein product [Sphagnum jensenii]|uniref:Tetraspanin-18 n=1 Tax=Sphagnum jensenii TaxID=128206 RepID=A0ABP1A8P3_9BRYO
MTCQGFLQCTLKLLNFLVALVGAFMILYSLWMLKEWHSDIAPPSSSDSPSPSPTTSLLDGNLARDGDFNILNSFSLQVTDAGMEQLGRPFLSYQKSTVALPDLPDLPDPWFIYAFMAGGIFTLLVTCTGHVAAETSNSFCLSCYTVIQIVLLLVQFAIAGVLFFDSHWHEDLPDDPTGELDKIKEFLEDNLDICKWVALSVVVLEVLGLFFATVLRAVSASTQRDYDSDEEYLAARASRQAVGNHQQNQATTPTAPGAPGDTRLPRKDAWSTRMRDKFGVDTAEFSGAQQNAATPAAGAEQQSSWCTIM